MHFLITGGYGAFGYHVAKALEEMNHVCSIYDRLEDWHFEEEYEKPKNLALTFAASNNSFMQALQSSQAKAVIHCAEQTVPDISMAEHIIFDNLQLTTHIIQTCSQRGIRCIIPCWTEFEKEPIEHSDNVLWRTTLAWKAKLPKYFNVGNAVNSVIFLPRLIGPYFNDNTFGNVVKRLYRFAAFGNAAVAYESEFPKKKYSTVPWIDADLAAMEVVQQASVRSRLDYYVDGIPVSTYHVAEHALHLMKEITGIEPDVIEVLDQRSDPFQIAAENRKATEQIQALSPSLERTIGVWERSYDE